MRVLHLGGNRMGERVRRFLREYGEDVTAADDLSTVARLRAENPDAAFDWLVSSGFPWIVGEHVLSLAKETCNLHPSLLPWGRGVNPNVWAIVEGEPAGVSIHRMEEAVDAGAVYVQQEVDSWFSDTGAHLYQRLEDAAVALFVSAWPALRACELTPIEQREGGSCHRRREFAELCDIQLDDQVTWRRALDILRALTFPPYRNATFDVGGRTYHVEVRIEDVTNDAK